MSTSTATDTAAETIPQRWCRVCHGPCMFYAGEVHGWTCRGCLRRYVDDQISRADERDAAERGQRQAALTAKVAQKLTAMKANGDQSSRGGSRKTDGPDGGKGDGCGPALTAVGAVSRAGDSAA